MGDSMYNEEIKRKFLEEFDPKQSRGGGPTAIMQKIGPYEESIGKDIAEMTMQEAQRAIISAKFREYSVLRLAISIFRKYSEWCMKNNVFSDMPDGVRSLKAKDFDLSDGMAENAFKDEEEFFNTLKTIYSFEDGIADVPYLALAWAGLKKKEIIELLDSEIDLDNRVVLNHDGTIMIPWFSDAVFDALTKYVNCKRATRGHHSGVKDVIKDMSVNTFLKKMLMPNSKDFGTHYKQSTIDTHIKDEQNKCSSQPRVFPTFMNVWNSGRYYHLYSIEQSGVDVYAPENKELVESVFRSDKKYFETIKMYDNYKKAFNL